MSKCKPVKADKPLAWVLRKSNQVKVEKQLLTLSNYAGEACCQPPRYIFFFSAVYWMHLHETADALRKLKGSSGVSSVAETVLNRKRFQVEPFLESLN